jgi:hypothetical protein
MGASCSCADKAEVDNELRVDSVILIYLKYIFCIEITVELVIEF